MSFELNNRHQQILRATVRQYIATAEPVGSKTLVDGHNLNISSATIRNGFTILEKAGLLYQPHTSAGRVPSDSGYRLYVDRLMQPVPNIGWQVEGLFADKLDWEGWSLEAVLKSAAEVLATLSGYITMIALPQANPSTIKHIQFVRIEVDKVMSIVVLDSYQTQSILMELPQTQDLVVPEESIDLELQVLSNFLNSKLRGKSLLALSTLDWNELDNNFRHYVDLITVLFGDLARQSQSIHSSQMMIRGIAEVLRQPEFAELEEVKKLLHLLESEQDRLWQLIFDRSNLDLTSPNIAFGDRSNILPTNNPPKITIRIGAENPLKPMQTCTLISTTYQQNSIPVGSIAVLGPKRMLYENAIALVQSAADYISQAISRD
jgi:heat-inducible transcriptional repressor